MKKIIIPVLIIVAAAAAFFAIHRRTGVDAVYEVASTTPAAISLKASAWQVFQDYIAAAKAHDLAKVKALSYQTSKDCVTLTSACKDRLDNAYNFGVAFKLPQFTHIIYDDKQLILYGNYAEDLTGGSPSRVREVLYFVRDGDNIKFLSLNPFQGSVVLRDEGMATSTIEARLMDLTIDTDGDTIPDSLENCADQITSEDCVKTNPTKKDTNGNGWWDSTESLFYR